MAVNVFLLICYTVCGGMPLGIFATQSEEDAEISQGIRLLRKLLPMNSFGGMGVQVIGRRTTAPGSETR